MGGSAVTDNAIISSLRRDPGLRSRRKLAFDAPGPIDGLAALNALRSSIDPTAEMPTIPQASPSRQLAERAHAGPQRSAVTSVLRCCALSRG